MSRITFVTGLWNIQRSSLTEGWSRTYEHYLQKFDQLLSIPNPLIVFGDAELKKFIAERKRADNTLFVLRDAEWFRNNDYYELIQRIRTNPQWLEQAAWLPESTQARLADYNPLVMSKMFLLHDAKIMDPFHSDYMFWIDAGLSNTVHPGYFTHDRVQDKLGKYFNKFGFVCFPYEAHTEIHGFTFAKLNEYAGQEVKLVARGGFFGGPKSSISAVNALYYQYLMSTLQAGYMGTEESVFSLLLYKFPETFLHYEIESNGLMGKFFEDLKEDRLEVKSIESGQILSTRLNPENVGLYVIGFNSPNQFETLITSMLQYDRHFLEKTQKFLLDNSTDLNTTPQYQELCQEYGFTHLKHNNLGICGGRQFIAEHADKHDFDYYFFFEDDMFFYPHPNTRCRNGFSRHTEGFYQKVMDIISAGEYDFLKLNYSEFFGDNGTQWSWYNVPQAVRDEYFPDKKQLPKIGHDPEAPRTIFNHIYSYQGVPYVDGEIYYSNWPQVVSKTGNKKMFLETTWAHPYEQTWMSHLFQLVKKGELKPALLLMTPTEHNRFDHYAGNLRREN